MNWYGTPYLWGGNWPKGILHLHDYYPSKSGLETLDPVKKQTWKIEGVDCPGLLHFVTNGYTPRNTSSLFTYGNEVKIEGKKPHEILETIQSLDLIVFEGHVIIFLNKDQTIESLAGQGVVIYDAEKRLSEIMKETHFVVRRWHPDQL